MKTKKVCIMGKGAIVQEFIVHAKKSKNIMEIIYVCEVDKQTNFIEIDAQGYPVLDLHQLISIGEEIDIILNFTGDESYTETLEREFLALGNSKTQVAQTKVRELIWGIVCDEFVSFNDA